MLEKILDLIRKTKSETGMPLRDIYLSEDEMKELMSDMKTDAPPASIEGTRIHISPRNWRIIP